MKPIGEQIRTLRGGLSQMAVAKKMGTSQSTIGMYEKGERFPDSNFILKFCEVFGVTPNFLFGYDEHPTQGTVAQTLTVNSPVHAPITTNAGGASEKDCKTLRQEVSALKDELIAQLKENTELSKKYSSIVTESAELKMKLASLAKK